MARQAQDREDLLRDATAFPLRLQLHCSLGECSVEVFVGFRQNQAVSIYFDQDPVYHFNVSGQLRRAFVADKLFKAEGGRLVSWTRRRLATEVAMVRLELTAEEQRSFCDEALRQLGQLLHALKSGKYEIAGQVQPSADGSVLERLIAFLEELSLIEVAATPAVDP